MNKIIDFFKSNKYAVIWTACYIATMWVILQGLFNFNMFSITYWNRLIHAELHGFAGFVFGILILAALPIYIATTTIIVRTKAPLFTIKLPAFLARLKPSPAPATTDENKIDSVPAPAPVPDAPPLPDHLPRELRGPFLRARHHTCPPPISSFNTNIMTQPPATPAVVPVPQMASATDAPSASAQNTMTDDITDFPLPTDFDLGDESPAPDVKGEENLNLSVPVFKEINFDDAPDETSTPTTKDTMPDTETMEFLTTRGNKIISATNDMIITDKLVIAIHDDPDFWIADDNDWFAAGKQKPSPTARLTATVGERGVRPVLYLKKNNIMDLDARRVKWESDGITVITDLNQLPE